MLLAARSRPSLAGMAPLLLLATLGLLSLSALQKKLQVGAGKGVFIGLGHPPGYVAPTDTTAERSLLEQEFPGEEQFLGNDQLPVMEGGCRVGGPEESRVARYLDYLPHIQGWMDRIHVGLVANITRMQHQECIQGGVGEIGTHHGKFFYGILSSALPSEPKLAVDLYEEQGLNYDMSGGHESGKLAVFRNHSSQLGYRASDMVLLSRDSTTLTPAALADMGLSAFRMFSVDGGHSFDVTMSDMHLAACALHKKGVFVVDDVGNRDWVGVLDSVITFTRTHPGVAPFLWTCNKMYFTTAASHKHYLEWARGHPCLRCSSNIPNAFGIPPHNSTYSIGGWEMCVSMDLDCQCLA